MRSLVGLATPQTFDAILRPLPQFCGRLGNAERSVFREKTICLRCQLQRASYSSTVPTTSSRATSTISAPRSTKSSPPWKTIPSQSHQFSTSSRWSAANPPSPSDRAPGDAASSPPQELPSDSESRRHPVSKRITSLLDNLQSNLFVASKRLNDLTGYTPIETLKSSIEVQESRLATIRQQVRAAKASYQDAISQRSASQREVNSLLQRKNAWTPADLERFTSLYRNDHANEQAEVAAQEQLSQAEQEMEKESEELGTNILKRYHEEQVWSDKIRRMSTWGTWGLMGVNVLLFFVFQVGVEPWRRRRLVNGFEEKVREAMEQERVLNTASVNAAIEGSKDHTLAPSAAVTAAASEPLPMPIETEIATPAASSAEDSPVSTIPLSSGQMPSSSEAPGVSSTTATAGLESSMRASKAAVQDLFSTRTITVRKSDMTTVALEGAATGAALVGTLCFVLLRRN
ncbi:MAG: hypothetical protein M4579_005449 [Chaenotheca gracillima]|nr:MAG: hypothetical protein M4579_005449 [Chaenotheca gracillima]